MTVQLAVDNALTSLRNRLKIPAEVPPFGDRTYQIYRLLWFLIFALAITGPAVGLYERFTGPSDNSGLMLGSRIGIVVAEEDVTRIRFPVGKTTGRLGVRPGDEIVAVDGIPLAEVMPFTPTEYDQNADDPRYGLLSELFYGTDPAETLLRIRSPDGRERDVRIEAAEGHIAEGARAMGIPPALLRVVDLLHVITYPFLLAAAWLLHKRQPRDPVSCILSLAVLLTMLTEQPSATFLGETIGAPRFLHVFLYDLGNIFLLAGILLFPHGRLSNRLLVLLALLPVLMFLSGDIYRGVFMGFMLLAVVMQIDCLRKMAPGEVRQQIKWGLFGFAGYAAFLAASLINDMLKWQVDSFSAQLILEMTAGLNLGIAFLALQAGLLIALVRYRLYDAEFVISRSASFAVVTLIVGALVAGGIQGLGDTIKSVFGSNAGAGAAGVGAAMATVLISPIHERIHKWMERRFHEKLLNLKSQLPETVRDLREVASLPELLQDVLSRIHSGIQTVRSAIIVEGRVEQTWGVSEDEAWAWLDRFSASPEKRLSDASDPLFLLRVPLCADGQVGLGWLVVGPRPDGSPPGKDERETLMEIADPLARAIRIVLKRDKEERDFHDLIDVLRQRIERIEESVGTPRQVAQG